MAWLSGVFGRIGGVLNGRAPSETVDADDSVISQVAQSKLEATEELQAEGRHRLDDFRTIFGNEDLRQEFNKFLDTIFIQLDKEKLAHLIEEILQDESLTYEQMYEQLLARIGETKKGTFQNIRDRLKSLSILLETLIRQIGEILGEGGTVRGYAEIGYPGRLIRPLKGTVTLEGQKVAVTDQERVGDYVETGFPRPYDKHVSLQGYPPLTTELEAGSLELVTMPIGLHHIPEDQVDGYVQSISDVIKPGGSFILRDHDAQNDQLRRMANVVHSVFNAATGVEYAEEIQEERHFKPLAGWIEKVEEHGFRRVSEALIEQDDPTANALLRFVKLPSEGEELKYLETYMRTSRHYTRAQQQTYLTTLEWHLVATADEYAEFTMDNALHRFPFFEHVHVLWQVFVDSCRDGIRASSLKEVLFSEYMLMNLFMVITTTLELLFKGMAYAPLTLFDRRGSSADTKIAKRLATISGDYAEYIEDTPFYKFNYFEAVRRLWAAFKNDASISAPCRTLLSFYIATMATIDFVAKGVMSAPLNLAYDGVEPGTIHLIIRDPEGNIADDEVNGLKVIETVGDFKAIRVPRYLPFTTLIKDFAAEDVQFVSIAGQKHVQLKVQVNERTNLRIEGCTELSRIPILTQPEPEEGDSKEFYVRLDVEVEKLHTVVQELTRQRAQIKYVHDF